MSRTMKQSGIPWIGEIPQEWSILQLKRLKDKSHPYPIGDGDHGSIKPEDYIDEGIPYIRVQNMTWGGDLLLDNIAYISEEVNDRNLKSELHPKDILIAKTGATIGKTAIIPDSMPKANTTSSVAKVTISKQQWYKYVFYVLGSDVCITQMWLKAQQKSAQPGFNIDELVDFILPLPSLPEQQKIASFLDRKCAEIDEMIALQEKIVEELKEYKQSVITEAVTKGLNPDATMKDSGTDWIGEIPEHWMMKPLKYCFIRRSERNNSIRTTERLSLSIDKGVTLYSEKTTNLDRFKDDFTQYQLAYPNDIVLNCMNMIVGAVGLSKYLGCVSPVYYVIYPSYSEIDAEYYSYLLNTPTIRGVYHSYGKGIYAIERGEGRVNTCRLKVSYDDLGRFDIPIPPVKEQKYIVKYITNKCTEIDNLISIKLSKIDSLKEYKKSIIYEYVTGKKEVIE